MPFDELIEKNTTKSGRVGLGVKMVDMDFMHMGDTHKEEHKKFKNNYSRNMKPDEIDEIETQGGRIFDEDRDGVEKEEFKFDLRPVQR